MCKLFSNIILRNMQIHVDCFYISVLLRFRYVFEQNQGSTPDLNFRMLISGLIASTGLQKSIIMTMCSDVDASDFPSGG